VDRERRLERVGGARVGADRLDADAHQRALVGDPACALDVEAGRVRAGLVGVEELRLVVARASQPVSTAASRRPGRGPCVGLELADVVDGQEEVGVLGGLRRLVDHDGRPDEPLRRDRATSSPSRPLTQWIGASKCVPTCSPISSQYHAQAGRGRRTR
jgi:hypothetical protein